MHTCQPYWKVNVDFCSDWPKTALHRGKSYCDDCSLCSSCGLSKFPSNKSISMLLPIGRDPILILLKKLAKLTSTGSTVLTPCDSVTAGNWNGWEKPLNGCMAVSGVVHTSGSKDWIEVDIVTEGIISVRSTGHTPRKSKQRNLCKMHSSHMLILTLPSVSPFCPTVTVYTWNSA